MVKPPGTLGAVKEIYRNNGFGGLYTGFRLHFGIVISTKILEWELLTPLVVQCVIRLARRSIS